MRKRFRILSGVLSVAMLVGFIPTSAFAAHTHFDMSQSLGDSKLYINAEEPYDREFTDEDQANHDEIPENTYPYILPITEEQRQGNAPISIRSNAEITMSDGTMTQLKGQKTLDVKNTKFMIFMGLNENMSIKSSSLVFNSTFLQPDVDAPEMEGISVRRIEAPEGAYKSEHAVDMYWEITGDLENLKLIEDYTHKTTNTSLYQYFSSNDDTYFSYLTEENLLTDFTYTDAWSLNTGSDSMHHAVDENQISIYAIPVKLNWETLKDEQEITFGDYQYTEGDENTYKAGKLYSQFSSEDWQCPMELTAPSDGTNDKGISIDISIPQGGLDDYIPTTSDTYEDIYDWYYSVSAMPIAGMIWGEIFQYAPDGNGNYIRQKASATHGGQQINDIQAGTILVQFALATPGTIKVTKTIEGLPADAEMPDSLAVTLTDQNGNPARDLNGNVVTASIDKGNWTYDEETGNWTATIQVEGLRPYDETYGWDYQYNVAVAEESGFEGYSRDGGISISDNTELTLENQYELTRNEDGTVNYEEKNDATVPEVKVTSKYTTETPPVEKVTLTYDGNGGEGNAPGAQTVDKGSNVTIAANTFSRDGYTFTGWNTQADGTGTAYTAGETISLSEDTTLYAQWAKIVDWNGSEVGKTATNLDINYQSDVTLSLPAAGYQKEVDVVFAIDCSSVLENNAGKMANALYQMAQELLEKEHILLNIGVVGYGHNADVLAELQPVNAENADDFLAALTAAFENSLTDDSQIDHDGGSNVQVGIRVAKNLLDSSTTGTTANNRHLILMTDGAGFYYCRSDEDSTSVSTVHNGDKKQAMGNMDATTDVGGAKKNTGELYGKVDRTKDSKYQKLVTEGKNFGDFIAEQGDEIKESAINSFSKSKAATVSNEQSYTTAQVQNFDTYPYINMERGTYFAAQELRKAKDAGYQITTIGYPYQAGSGSEALQAVTAGFRAWTATIGDYYDGSTDIDAILSSISDEFGQYVDAGSKVVDEIGSGTDNLGNVYNFNFVNDIDQLTLTVGGKALNKATVTEDLSVGETARYTFGTDEDPAQFVLHYYANSTTLKEKDYSECFVWDINVPVTMEAPVQLKYTVKLTDPQTAAGTYGEYDEDGLDEEGNPLADEGRSLFTNNSATLFPVSSDSVATAPVSFPKPTVSYTTGAIRIWPADITIYTGGDGYESVVTGSGNSQVGTASDGLPEPGFYVELPAALNQFMIENAKQEDITEVEIKDENGNVTGTQKVVDLSDYLSFTYDDGQGNIRLWKLERYDNQTGNDSMAYSRYIYRILPAVVDEETIPIRLQFEAPDGTLTTSDDFTIQLDGLFQEYGMSIYPGALNQDMVQAQITLDNKDMYYDTVVDKGKLTVRGVTDQDTTTTEVVKGDAPAGEVEDITAHVPGDTQFYINESQLEVADPSKVELLVDSIVPDENNTLQNSAISQFDEITSSQQVQLNYLDLVDTSNGNAWVTASEPITVYWPYPEGTDQSDTFYIVHYEDLDRNDNNALATGDYTMELYSADQGNLENTPQGIKITVESFSPFALFWGESGDPDWPPVDPDPDPDPDPNPDPDPGDKPELNTEDHYAYIVGYPDGNVKPEGNITRAEVATIFFRLLTDESRDEFWSQTNPYSDVSEDDWYNNAVSTLTNAGIIDGYEDGTFKPNGNITRAEFATIAVRFFEATYEGENLFPDIDGHWAQDYINEAANAGIVDGYPDGTFRPQQYITRAEAMTMVNRTIDRHPDADHLLDDMIVWPDNPETAWYYEQVQEATNSHEYTMNTDDEQNPYEIWTELLPVRDWEQLEKEWSDAHSGQSGGDVV